MQFEFVNDTSIDHEARRRIRSHVMRGRNVGKKRVPRHRDASSRIVRVLYTPKILSQPQREESDESVVRQTHREPAIAIRHHVGNELSFLPFKADLTPRSLDLVYNFLTILKKTLVHQDLYPGVKAVDSVWVQSLFQNEAYFHCSVAMSAACANSQVTADVAEGLRHLSLAMHLVNEKLSSSDALADSTIAAIVAMTQFERLRGRNDQAMTHFKGLQRIVEMRGGIGDLARRSPAMLQKILRADVELALYYGTTTRFNAADVPGYDVLAWVRCMFFKKAQPTNYDLKLPEPVSAGLYDIFVDISSLVSFLNGDADPTATLDAYALHDLLVLINYRLIRLQALKDLPTPRSLEDALFLALSALMTGILPTFGGRLADFPLLSQAVRAHCQSEFDKNTNVQRMLLWMLFIGRMSILGPNDDIWLVPKVRQVLRILGLDCWVDTHQALRRYPWVGALHDDLGKALWDQVMLNRRSIPLDQPQNRLC